MADGPRDAWNYILVDALGELDADAAGIALSTAGVQTSVCRGALPADRKMGPFTVMYAASLTKQLMGTLAAMAITKGWMDYRTPVTDLVPALPLWMCTVQIEHLLHHTSGLPEVARDIRSPVADNATLLELLRAEAGLTAPPGTVHAYSNTGYVALALALEAAFDMPIAHLGVEMVFAPLEMAHSRLGGPPEHRLLGQVSPPGTIGDGGWWTCLADVQRWLDASNEHFLGDEVAAMVQQPGRLDNGELLDYAWGVRVSERHSHTVLAHGGSWPGWLSRTVRIPDLGIAISVLASGADEATLVRTVSTVTDRLLD